jgi:CHAT domain-containing protein
LNLAVPRQSSSGFTLAESVWDDTAAIVTQAIYTQLLHNSVLDLNRAARALHHAIRQLRDADPEHPSTWAAFIHTGP